MELLHPALAPSPNSKLLESSDDSSLRHHGEIRASNFSLTCHSLPSSSPRYCNAIFRRNVRHLKLLHEQQHRSREVWCPCHSSTTMSDESTLGTFSGIGDVASPVLLSSTRTLPTVLSLSDAREALVSAMVELQSNPPQISSGIIRLQVAFCIEVKALYWLQSQSHINELSPRVYFSPRGQCGEGFFEENVDVIKSVAGIGSAVLFKGQKPFSSKHLKSLKRFLSKDNSLIRAYGALRFNADIEFSEEWKPFGSFFFCIPQIELCECTSCSLLALTVAWDEALGRDFDEAAAVAKRALFLLSDCISTASRSPLIKNVSKEHTPSEREWHGIMKDLLEVIKYDESNQTIASQRERMKPPFHDAIGISKVVLARKTNLEVDALLEPLTLLSTLQSRDPNAYQFCIQISNKSAFIGSTPERLFYKDGFKVFSEAVAGTRACGITENKDYGSSIELLLSTKDHTEFDIVMESVKQRLEVVCKDVKVKSYKSLKKQANVQHLCGRLDGLLLDGSGEFELLSELHPTPAVCGQPQDLAKRFLSETESFDRGMYAGPVGWISGDKAEFAVAIRSSLLELRQIVSPQDKTFGTRLCLFAGVGIVKGAKSSSEWKELDLKIQQFEALLQPFSPLQNAVNINALWAKLIVEECCRLGVTYFCIAPGSRSSPLAVAASGNHNANCVSCIDERSLAFHALGYGRGACKPAVVITSSGTAVSNLLPAVVEASEDCVPLILMTADRPPELQQCGANQTIDQVKHFGSFVRYQTNLPPPSDEMHARMVLTSVDAAIFQATSPQMGPVHVNIGFREPLAATPNVWDPKCLEGLERWVLQSQPFTQYATSTASDINKKLYVSSPRIKEIVYLISSASRGLLVAGGLQKMEQVRAVLLLARHLGWPVVPDILSGIRLRHVDEADEDEELCVIDYFDHVLLSTHAHDLIKPDVVLQLGGRLTSKRLGQFLELCHPCAYILVEEHPFRFDPSHSLTHRVHGCVIEFATQVIACCASSGPRAFAKQLKLLSDVIGQEINFQLEAELTLSEPNVARIVANSLTLNSAFFLGNSMSVRDVDMYSQGALRNHFNASKLHDFPGTIVRTVGNRGASGIDGILSTAIGFAIGSEQRVTLLLGDVSFLHDTNGLMLLKRRAGQPSVVVVVVNNSGGGIFSLLPIANTASGEMFTKFFTMPHDVSIRQLCLAHKVNHTLVQSRQQLVDALLFIQKQQLNWVVEVRSSVEDNADFHRYLQSSARQAMTRAIQVIQQTDVMFGQGFKGWAIKEAVYHPYRFLMSANPTTTMNQDSRNSRYRKGFIFCIHLCNGVIGYGEVAPLVGLHKENLLEAEEQLMVLAPLLQGAKVSNTVALLNGSFAKWISKSLGIMPETLLPSVRCGLEMAVLGALAAANNCSMGDLLTGHVGHSKLTEPGTLESTTSFENQRSDIEHRAIRICGLLDSCGSPSEMASAALHLVQQGFCTLKVKVARRVSPLEDAAVLLAIRKMVGPEIHLRADANQRWTFDQAVEFASAVRCCGLQYLEEPVKDSKDLLRFCKETGLPVGIDESIDSNAENIFEIFSHLGLAAAIIKPSSVGGFERAAVIAKWAQRNGMLAVISAAFESSIGLAAYAQFAAFVDQRRLETITAIDVVREGSYPHSMIPAVAHGLGTFMWLEGDVLHNNRFSVKSTMAGFAGVEVAIQDAARTLKNILLDKGTVLVPCPARIHSSVYAVTSPEAEFRFQVFDIEEKSKEETDPVLVFFHGFLGTGSDWLPIMQSLSLSNRCISLDLPGHGKTTLIEKVDAKTSSAESLTSCLSIKSIADALDTLLADLTEKKVILVGYSMGARLALYMALKCNQRVAGAVIISGSPGIKEPEARYERAAQDDALSLFLQRSGLESFIKAWYQKPMWTSLRRKHRSFATLSQTRTKHQDLNTLGRVLSSMSIGRQPSLWENLGDASVPLLLVAGKDDVKFSQIAHKMYGDNCGGERTSLKQATSSKVTSGNIYSKFGLLSGDGGIEDLIDRELRGYPLEDLACPQDRGSKEEEQNKLLLVEAFPLQRIQRKDEEKIGRRNFMTLLELEDTGHAVHIENPLLLIRGIRKFVARVKKSFNVQPGSTCV